MKKHLEQNYEDTETQKCDEMNQNLQIKVQFYMHEVIFQRLLVLVAVLQLC